ncbi:protocadherin alpha-6-like isoform X6 [Ascaphus truei]|uniref:protocadherin alpha-6-like isoform X6 n=1 Tax=Ascaphus truei TaxID=8439 RepID=UPI003F5AB7C2
MHLEVIADKPVQIYHVQIEIEDINDNYPLFSANEFKLVIAESRLPGSRFPLEGALDADVGTNSIMTYQLSSSEYFVLDVQTYTQESKSLELVLKKALDREHIPVHNLTLTASDGGKPKLSGTAQLEITVQDVNDNAPTFSQLFYQTSVSENSPKGTFVVKVNSTDLDQGENGVIVYAFNKMMPSYVTSLFSIDENTGIIRVEGDVDFEKSNLYEIQVDAVDKGQYPMAGHCKVLVNILDMNDNPPELTVTSLNVPVPEDSSPGTVVAIISAHDRDSGVNGKVNCHISEHIPFKIKPTFMEYYSLVVNGPLDREVLSQYEVVVTARDEGIPVLSVTKTIRIEISDVNDNAPSFVEPFGTIFIKENNAPGSHIYTVSAFDSDVSQNSFITYSLIESTIDGIPISSYISVNPENGKLYALLSFDYEQITFIHCQVRATDAGLPSLSSNLTLNVFILDINDNAPTFSPPFIMASTVTEMVPRSATVGYLVTKVKAFDADCGYNAWLSYEFKDPAENTPFSIGRHTGAITLTRSIKTSEREEYKVFIVVKDHGEPEMSATTTVNVMVVETKENIDVEHKTHERKYEGFAEENVYLIMSICLITSLFLIVLIVYASVKWHKHTQEVNELRKMNVCSSTTGSWIYSQQLQYKMCMNGMFAPNDLILFTPNCAQQTEQDGTLNQPKQPHPDWRYSASLRAAMQSAVHVEGSAVLRQGPGGLEQQWPTVSSATPEPDGGEVSPPVGAGVNCNSWTFKYGPGNPKQPVPQIPPDFPENFIIPGSPAIISIRQDQPSAQDPPKSNNFITFGKKEETKKKKKKKKGSKNQEKGNNAADNSDQ